MNSTTRPFSKTRRYAASVVATAVVAVGAVACGTETIDDVEPGTPAQVKVPAAQPQSANLAKERYETLKRHFMPPADSHKAAERSIEKEQEALRQFTLPGADSHKAAERDLAEQDKDRGLRYMGRPGPGF